MTIDTQEIPAGLTHLHSGKVRDLFLTQDGQLLILASDRISAFDYILPTPIPDKGRILTAMTVWWFEQLAELVPNHMISVTDPAIPAQWRGRAMLCERLDMVPIEAVARGYLTGSGLLDYRVTGSVCGVALPPGLDDGDQLPWPIFTPATKAAIGEHDENISYEAMAASIGEQTAAEFKRLTLAIYSRAAAIAAERGILLADTKFEFGRGHDGHLVLGDEVLTPDSSRFWPADSWQPGHAQVSYDKQYLRDWLLSSGWDRLSGEPPPALPAHVVHATRNRYLEAYQRLTGLTI